MRADFGFAAGKADFSFDGRQVTFHISKHDYLTPFVSGGLTAPAITDVVVADLVRDGQGRITGVGGVSRLTTSTTEGVGSYFPAFMPDGMVFYVANEVPKQSSEAKRFRLAVVDPSRERRVTELFTSPARREAADAIGELWRQTCAPTLTPFRPQEAAWAFTSLSSAQCRQLVEEKWLPATDARKASLLAACDAQVAAFVTGSDPFLAGARLGPGPDANSATRGRKNRRIRRRCDSRAARRPSGGRGRTRRSTARAGPARGTAARRNRRPAALLPAIPRAASDAAAKARSACGSRSGSTASPRALAACCSGRQPSTESGMCGDHT